MAQLINKSTIAGDGRRRDPVRQHGLHAAVSVGGGRVARIRLALPTDGGSRVHGRSLLEVILSPTCLLLSDDETSLFLLPPVA